MPAYVQHHQDVEIGPVNCPTCMGFLPMYVRERVGELLRCGWHGWEFDMRNGQSWFDPKRVKVRSFPVAVESGEELQKGPYVAETFPVTVEDSYVIIET